METMSLKQDTALALQAAFIAKGVETGRLLGILDVEEISPDLAEQMRRLGYRELSADLLKAFERSGTIEDPEPGQVFLGPLATGSR